MPVLSSKELLEKRGEIAKQIKDLAELANGEARDFTPEEAEKWAKLDEGYNAHTRDLNRILMVEKIDADMQQPVPQTQEKRTPGRGNVDHRPDPDDSEERGGDDPTDEDRALALQSWFRAGTEGEIELTPRHKMACRKTRFDPNKKTFRFRLHGTYRDVKRAYAEKRDLSINLPTAGSYLIPEGFIANLERAMLEFGGMRQVADVMRTTSGEPMPWPTVNDTSNEGVLINENTAVTELDPAFGNVTFYAHKYTSRMVQVPNELLEDSAFNLAVEIGSILGERLGRIGNRHCTTGDGAGKPYGVVTRATVGVTTAAATAITADEIIDLIHSVDPSYRTNASFMLNDGIIQYIRKLKDGTGQYLWQPGLQAGVPDRILGYPVVVNQHMQSTVATGTRTVLFGAFNKYKIRDVGSIRMKRLDERYADSDQVAFLAFARLDGNLLDAGTNPVKCIVQA